MPRMTASSGSRPADAITSQTAEADTVDVPGGRKALLHGIDRVSGVNFSAAPNGCSAIRLWRAAGKAQQSANGFFLSQGMSRLQAQDP